MAAFTEENVEAILSACETNTAALAESLSQCFDQKYRMEVGESGIWSSAESPAAWSGPGLFVLLQVGEQALAVLVPESLPLADWYRHPNDSQKSRLETLAMEWSMNLLPADFETERFRSLVVDDLGAALGTMSPAEWAATCELDIYADGDAAASPQAKLLVVWPLEQPKFDDRRAPEPAPAPAAPTKALEPPRAARHDPFGRLRQLPVTVSVRLAEKKIPMSQLLGITPGMLITFNKSCEDLLDLYVNNSRYCRGEAVKIGENFGLKINQVGVKEETPQKIIDA